MLAGRLLLLGLFACVAIFALGGAFVLLHVPFPTPYDELQHVSFIAAMREAPQLFPHYGDYFVLHESLIGWSDARNYLAHPPLYYLLLTPFDGNVPVLRMINLAMATTGFALCAAAGVKLLGTLLQRCMFLSLLLVFSKPALIAGMVNNDNLVLLETGVLFWLLAGQRSLHSKAFAEQASQEMGMQDRIGLSFVTQPRAAPQDEASETQTTFIAVVFIALVLAAIGWTKLNAFVGLTMWVGLFHLFDILARRVPLFGYATGALIVGVLVGAIPTIANLMSLGVPAYVPVDFLFVEPSMRPPYDLGAFIAAFWHKIGQKVFYIDGLVDLIPVVIATSGLAICARLATPTRIRDVALSASIAMLGFAALHTFYGWNSFRALGTMSDAQSRYYVMLWPGFALAAVLGGSTIAVVASEAKQSIRTAKRSGLLRRLRSSQ